MDWTLRTSWNKIARILTPFTRPTGTDGVVLFLIVLVFFWRLVVSREVFLPIEDLQTNWAAQYYEASQIRHGIFPLWDICTWAGGVPILARSEFGYTHPINLLFNLLSLTASTLAGTAKWILDYNAVFHHFLAAFFTYLFCRFGMRLGRIASIGAGLTWSFSGFFIGNLTHRMFATTSVYLPLVLLFFELYVQENRIAYAVLAGLASALCLVGGYIQISGYVVGFVLLYVLWAAAVERRLRLAKVGVFLCLFFLFGIGSALIQLIPQMELISLSERNDPFWGSYAYAIYGHLDLKDLITLLAPYRTLAAAHWNERLIYFGTVSLVIILLGIIRAERKKRLLFPGLFMILCLLHMLGPGFGVNYLAFNFLPVLGKFHHPVRSAVLFDFCAAMLVGLSLDACRMGWQPVTSAATPRHSYGRLAGICIFAILEIALILTCLFGMAGSWSAMKGWFKPDLIQAFLFLIGAGAFALCSLIFIRFASAAALLFVAILGADLFLFNSKSPWHTRPGNAGIIGFAVADHAQLFGEIKRGEPCRVTHLSNSAWAIGLQTIEGYSDHNMIREYSHLYYTYVGRTSTLFYDLLNVKYLLFQRAAPGGVDVVASSYYVGHPGEHAIDRNPATEWVEAKTPNSWSDSDVTGDWLLLTFAEPVTVAKIAIAPRVGPTTTPIRRLRLEFQNGMIVDAPLNNEGELQVASFAPQKASTLKMTIVETGNVISKDVGFREIYLYDGAGNDLIAAARGSKYRQAIESDCYENLHVLPRAWLVGDFRVSEPKEIFHAIEMKSFDPRRTVFLEKSPAAYQATALPLGDASATIERYEPNHITVRCRTPRAAILVLSEVFYPGWQARIGGERTAIYRADYALRAVVVPAGETLVEFDYSPLSFKVGLAGTLGTVAAAILLMFFTRRRPTSSLENAALHANGSADRTSRRDTPFL